MVRPAIKSAEEIRRREVVPEDQRTQERTKAADWIEENIIKEGRWGEMPMREIAEESQWSRQHIANTLDAYFEPADSPAGLGTEGRSLDYRQGFRDGIEFVRENPLMFGLRREE